MRFVGNLGLAVALATVVAGTAVAIAASWGGAYFLPGAAAGILTSAAALLRSRGGRLRAALAGLAVAAAAVVVAQAAGLPAEPAPATALALAVLIGSVTRVAPVRTVAAVAAAGLAVVAAGAFTRPGWSGAFAVTVFGVLAWAGGVLTGGALRLLDARRLAAVEAVRRDERLTIARELHDVVAHHVTGIVVQAQAAQLVARKDPAKAGRRSPGSRPPAPRRSPRSAGSSGCCATTRARAPARGAWRRGRSGSPTSSAGSSGSGRPYTCNCRRTRTGGRPRWPVRSTGSCRSR
ncbi:histidine kinase dimerization/phosphoacceptor domain-containing protein [Dactylosporangium sp. NBC_01737]|uniref:histidine kinase dimerization/phosphoacceptor domain-containing protein n=1 Tax=Dactylosporangium sp. NBC_01737 TaxID=2975959 RepID=UPI002E0E4172|nr:histidine kinase dimerization/phosphoacceptor domain-containing protein [Dactylosporangium sp. NBC_01737]